MHVELRHQLAHRLVALQRRQRDFRLESWAVVSSRSFCHIRSFVPATLQDWERKIHLTHLFRFPEPPLFIDTNILKFAAVKKHVYRSRLGTVDWGGTDYEVEYHERYTVNDIHKIKNNETLKSDAILLGMLAYAGISGRLKFHSHREVYLETLGLRGMCSASGRFFGCPIHRVADPMAPRVRIISDGKKSGADHALDFLSRIRHPRYGELTRMTGAYQGPNKPLIINQAMDAYHLWCAECAGMNYFLTMDYRLQKVVSQSKKVETPVVIKTPNQLLREVLPKFGLVGAFKFLWQGYRFAKPRVGFDEGKGWT
ncbi:hypothetical protein [Roseovarius sp.]|uniref:hypothetical protein n=1 Tax=Roseovarius sp. TaxID=1486281 RepID=UPI003BAD53D4